MKRLILSLAIFSQTLVLFPINAFAQSSSIKVMPLGDSITDGYNIPGGYRIDLEDKGIPINFVGSLSNGPSSLSDKNHEGHSGWRIDEIQGSVVNWLNTYQPQYVLLLIGTNDVLQNYNLSQAPNRLATLIDTITNTLPNANVFVGTLPPLSNSGHNANVVTFNNAIPGIINQRRSQGKLVHQVNLYNALSTSDLADGVHPNASGYSKIATQWYNALVPLVGTPASPTATPTPGPTVSPLPNGPLSIISPLNLSSTNVQFGQNVTGTVTYRNTTSNSITISQLAIASRPPGGTNQGGPYMDFSPYGSSITIQPGQNYTFSASRSFTSSDQTGNWYAFSTYNVNGTWYDAPANLNVSFTVGVQATNTPTASPSPTPKPGDANGDGKVDGLDYVRWLNNYNRTTSAGASEGDFNGDGKVDGLDYVRWLNNYNR